MLEKKKYVKTIAVASGKGGVGKTNVAANLAIAMQKLGKKVMIMDGDLGLSNINVLLNLAPKHNIQHLLTGLMSLKEIVVEGPHGILVLPAGSGMQELLTLNELQRLKILQAFDSYDGDINVLLIDTAAGISENVAFFCIAAQEIIIVTSPEPTSIADACALIKVLYSQYHENDFIILVNSAKSAGEAFEVFKLLSLAMEKFVNISLDYFGFLPYDDFVPAAVRAQKAFLDLYPQRDLSKKIFEIAGKFMDRTDKVKGTLQFFIGNLLSATDSSSVNAGEKNL